MPVSPAAIERLRELGDASGQDLLAAIIASFRRHAPELVAELSEALDGGRFEEVGRLAHTLRGSAATFGAEGLVERCRELQQAAYEDDAQGARDLLAATRETLREVLAALDGDAVAL